jgi:hypothetical protein
MTQRRVLEKKDRRKEEEYQMKWQKNTNKKERRRF